MTIKKHIIDITKDEYFIKIKNIINDIFISNVKIILFGSRARGDYHDNSDYDICILSEKEDNSIKIALAKDILEESIIPFKVELIDYYSASKEFQELVLLEGIEWKD